MPISVPLTRYRKSDLPEGHPHRTEDYAHLAPDTWDEPDYRRNPHTHPNIATHYGLEEVRPPHPDLKQPRRAQYTYPAHSYTLVSPPPRPLLHCAGKIAHVAKYQVSPKDRKATLGCCSGCSRGSGAGPCDVKGATIEWRDEGEGAAPITFPARQPVMNINGFTRQPHASSERDEVKKNMLEGSNDKQNRNKRQRSWSEWSETASECLTRLLRATSEAAVPPTPESFRTRNTSPSLDAERGCVGLGSSTRPVVGAGPSLSLAGSGKQLATMLVAYQADLDATVQNVRQEARTEIVRLQAENSALKVEVARLERKARNLERLMWQNAQPPSDSEAQSGTGDREELIKDLKEELRAEKRKRWKAEDELKKMIQSVESAAKTASRRNSMFDP
ncbi:hypothetical protein EHS25_002995 [Saitozyma podzolica]|uniref:Uncharacterized protein n=1 Tax=Saitozyma podzolica TaxID=1890683 RepID=A0A427YCT1_9TREE|nr:hypothetical protein EHS25_002995 [Saitozyma podzolica]